MSSSFYQYENSSLNYSNTCYRVCRDINPWVSFEIPAPSPKRIITENEETTVLVLESFQRPAILNFGNVTLGNISTKSFKIHNPAHFIQKLDVVKVPKPEFGFTIKESFIVVAENQSVVVFIDWKPTKAGGTRQKIHFKTSYGESFELIVIGVAQEKWKTVTKRRVKPRRRPVKKLEKVDLSPVDPGEIKRVEAAVVIQKFVRRYLAVKRFQTLKKATITIQQHFRRYYSQKSINRRITFIKSKKSESLQELCKSIVENGSPKKLISDLHKLEESPDERVEAAIVIQKFIRRYLTIKRFQTLKKATITIQKHFRRHCAQKSDRHKQKKSLDERVEAAVVIQKFVRRYLAIKRFQTLKEATITIQKHFRLHCAQKSVNRLIKSIVENGSPKKLISDLHNQEESLDERVEAAVVIQKFARRYLAIKRFQTLKEATITIQKHFRRHCAQKSDRHKQKKSLDERVEAAIVIQKFIRRYLAIKRFQTLKKATITIQKHFRRYYAQKSINRRITFIKSKKSESLQELCQSIVENGLPKKLKSDLQKHVESPVDPDESIKRVEAAIVIQKFVRRYLAIKRLPALKESTIAIQPIQEFCQSIVENGSPKKLISERHKQEESLDERVEAAVVIQKFVRRYLAIKRFLARKKATITIKPVQEFCQSIVESVPPNKLISVCVNNLSVDESLQVNDAPDLPIGFRTNLALTKLVNYRKFIQLQSALSSLETTTKISPESCIKISSPKTVDTIIKIIKKSNRSEPSKIVVTSAFNILLNLIKYDKTQDLIVTCHSIINLCIEKAKVYIRVHHISNKCLTLLYLMIIKNVNRDLIICDPIVNKSLKSLINLESSTIKSHKKHKITKELVFYPYWSSAKSVMYEFTDHFTALEHINYLFKGKLF